MASKIGHQFFIFVFFISLVLFLAVPATSQILIDHNCTKLANIPSEWITAAKQTLHIAYGCSSHGSQLTTGMTGLVTWKGNLYDYNFGGANGALDLREWDYDDGFGYPVVTTYANDLGDPNRQAWAAATREYLNTHPEINVIIWAWCWQMMTDVPADIDLYLSLMNELEEDYPGVKFVYMTGHVTARQLWGEGTTWSHVHYMRAKQIRDYCAANNKILYDFADIESWDPDGNWYGDKLVDEACNYDSDGDGETDSNWAVEWQDAHPGEWYTCGSPHSEPLNANLKAYSAWWLWARLAGWSGEADITLSSVSLNPVSVLGGNSSTGTLTLSYLAPSGGAVVTLSSDDPAAQTPASVTVAEGETTAAFNVTTSTVTADTPVTISGTYNSTTQTATLTVTAPMVAPALTVTSPNGGETWAAGSTHSVTWTQTGMTGMVTIDLYKGGVWQKILGIREATAGTFSWTIASTEIAGTDYTIRIWQSGVSDDSDGNFTLVRRLKVDFNKDRQEDLLWRCYGTGDRQGDNVVWFMSQTEGLSPMTLGGAQGMAGAMPLLSGAAPAQTYMSPMDVGNARTAGRVKSYMSPMHVGNARTAGRVKAYASPADVRSPMMTGQKGLPEDASRRNREEVREEHIAGDAVLQGVESLAAGDIRLMALGYSDTELYTVLDTTWEIVGAGDFNGDGNTDVLWRYYGAGEGQGTTIIWYMNGTTITSQGYPYQVADTDWRIDRVGDFNGDGRADILWRYHGSGGGQGTAIIWCMDGATVIDQVYPYQVLDTDWKIDGIGDFDGDGNADLLWRYYGTGAGQGTTIIWYMDGTTILGQGRPTLISDTDWRIDTAGDFNGDGKADIMWRYYGTGAGLGTTIIWYMDGAEIKGQDTLYRVSSLDWRIVNR